MHIIQFHCTYSNSSQIEIQLYFWENQSYDIQDDFNISIAVRDSGSEVHEVPGPG